MASRYEPIAPHSVTKYKQIRINNIPTLQVILEYIGRDATAGFEGVGHSKSARVWRDKLLVGKLIEADRA